MSEWGALDALDLVLRVLVTAWIVVISVRDHRHGLISNRLTAPFFLGVGAFQILYALTVMRGLGDGEWWLRLLFLVVAYGITFSLWTLHFIGGGDAKFLMALFALFPTMDWVVLLALLLLVIMLPLLLLELRARRPGAMWRGFRDRLLTGQVLPTQEELQEQGRRYAWTFGVPAIVFTWLYWEGIVPYVDRIWRYMQGIV
jgi:Flp pilus assembly protein protease CpaA